MPVTITNRSDWPTWFVEAVGNWIMVAAPRRDGLSHAIRLILTSTKYQRVWSGRGGEGAVSLTISRRCAVFDPVFRWKDGRIGWSPTYLFHSNVELFVFLLAREMARCTAANQAVLRPRDILGRQRRAEASYHANEWGWAMLRSWCRHRAKLLPAWKRREICRRARRGRRDKQWRAFEHLKGTSEFKLKRARQLLAGWESRRRKYDPHICRSRLSLKQNRRMLAGWEARRRICDPHIRRWRKTVRSLRGAITKRRARLVK